MGPTLLCYDGSESARHAIATAASLLQAAPCRVLAVWQPLTAVSTFTWGGPIDDRTITEVAAEAKKRAEALAAEGVEVARGAGLEAEPHVVEASGPIWAAIADVADAEDAGVIVLGSRGLTGVRNLLLGSVSEGVVRHGRRPALVVHRDADQ